MTTPPGLLADRTGHDPGLIQGAGPPTGRSAVQRMVAVEPAGVRRPMTPCTAPGCPNLTATGGRCSHHRTQHDRERGSSTQRGYDQHHRRLRLLCFKRDGW